MIPVFFFQLLFQACISLAELDTRPCYDASNNIAPKDRPCISASNQTISHCCSREDTCVGDTLCLSQWSTLYVGSCTIKDWSAGRNGRNFCPKYCSTAGSGDIGVCSFADGTERGWEFCCGLDRRGIETCCKGDRFKIPGNATSTHLIQRPWELAAVSTGLPSPTPSSPTPSKAPAATQSSQCSAIPSNNKADAQIGLGVGLGVPLLIALGLLFWENRKRRRAEALSEKLASPAVNFEQHAHWDQPLQSYEVDGSKGWLNEMPSHPPVHELPQDRIGR